MDAIAIGKRISELRGEKSRKEVAEAIGVSVSAITMYENGDRIPRDETKIRIADYFHKPVGEIFYQ